MLNFNDMKEQDIVILLKKLTSKGRNLSVRKLAEELNMSASSVSESLERSKKAQLVDRNKKRVNTLALQEFMVHGLGYVFPAETGRVIRGIPAYVSASPIKEQVSNSSEQFVWRYAKGDARGQQITPLYPSVPEAALRDEGVVPIAGHRGHPAYGAFPRKRDCCCRTEQIHPALCRGTITSVCK